MVAATRAVALKAVREVAAKKSTVPRIMWTISVAIELNIIPKAKRGVIVAKMIVDLITEAIEMNAAREICSEKWSILGTNIPTVESVTDRTIVGRDRPERGIGAIDGWNRITENVIQAKDMSEEYITETGMRVVATTVLTLVAVRFPTDRILELSTIGIGKADSAMRAFAGTVATEEARGGVMRGVKTLDTGTTVIQRE